LPSWIISILFEPKPDPPRFAELFQRGFEVFGYFLRENVI
jgi:hypothetical protein